MGPGPLALLAAAMLSLPCAVAAQETAATGAEAPPPEDASAPPRIDPLAMEIAGDAARFLVAQPQMSFDWFVTFDEVVEGREKITFVRSGSNVMVRGEGFHLVAERNDGLREYFFDGKTFTVAAPEEGFYATAPFDGTLEALIEAVRARATTNVPMWSLMSADLGKDAVADIEAAAYLGLTRIAGEEAFHLAFSEYDEDWQIWISTDPDRPVPLMIVGTDPYQQGWPQYRAHMMNWSFDPPAEGAVFAYEPHEDDVRASMPALVQTERERLLGAETQALEGEEERQ